MDAVATREVVEADQTERWTVERSKAWFGALTADAVAQSMRRPVHIVHDPATARYGFAFGSDEGDGRTAYPLVGILPPLYPEWLGDRSFNERHGLRFAYMGGSMARGIASADLVMALAELGAFGMFGAAGLPLSAVEAAIGEMSAALDPRGLPWGCNLIHSPGEAGLEDLLVDLYLARGVRRVEASAFMSLTKAVVRYSCSGVQAGPDGRPIRARSLFAKVSREEVADLFLSPPPQALMTQLQAEGALSAAEVELARRMPVADAVIVEADSGGHTDNRPLGALLPVIAALRDALARRHGYAETVYVGAAGGLGTPDAVAAAFALGAAFVVVGSVHQATVESGVSDEARAMLAKAGPADVGMAASADMFEMGVKVQVLTRGTLMAARANRLYQLYRAHAGLEELPPATRAKLEADVFRMPLEEVWSRTRAFFAQDPAQIARAEADPKHRMALVFRWYLGNSSRWPLTGQADRRADYQLWCGPAMGSFNRWAAASPLEAPEARRVEQVALNLLEGAAHVTRAHQLRTFGLNVPPGAFDYRPERLQA